LKLADIGLAEAIKRYPAERYGVAWAILWDYKCEIEKVGLSILDDNHRWQTALELFAYLCCFGMGRASTRLTNITVDDFADVLAHLRTDTFGDLGSCRFEHFGERYEQARSSIWRQLQAGLNKHGVSTTDTMISKILMGLWGEMPAFDTSFQKTYRHVFGTWPGRVRDVLRQLYDAYEKVWQEEINSLPSILKHTQRGHWNPIPVPRLIDMAFWRLGSQD